MKPIPRQSSTTKAQSGKHFSHSDLLGSWVVFAFPWLYLLAALLVLATLLVLPFPSPISLPQLSCLSLSWVLFMVFLRLGEKRKALHPVSGLIPAPQTAAVSTKRAALLSKIRSQPPSRRKADLSQLAAFSPEACCRVDTSIAGKTPTQRHSIIKMCLALSQQSPGD